MSDKNIEQSVVNNIKTLGIDMINEAKSGHPGIVLGAANIIYTIYQKHLIFNPKDINWPFRDKFVLSAGHGSALLYSTLYFNGYDLTLDDLKEFRQIHSKTPGHPEYLITPGVEVSTGPLGQGLAHAVGMALANKILKATYDNEKYKEYSSLYDNYIYVLCGDGDIMEGIASEAASFAGSHKLNNLIVLYDSNNISLDGNTNMTFTEDVCSKYHSLGFNVIKIENDLNQIDAAITKAKSSLKPVLIEVKTVIGKDSLLENTNQIHGKPLTELDIKQLKEKYNMPDVPFYVNEELKSLVVEKNYKRSNEKYNKWINYYNVLQGDQTIDKSLLFKIDNNLDVNSIDFDINDCDELRNINCKILEKLVIFDKKILSGSADLGSSTKTYLLNNSDLTPSNYLGKNIWYGVREHAMGAITNGIALSGFKPLASTFLSFSDYMLPAIRMSAIMNLNSTFIFTHDSVSIGSDGPTHQPTNQLLTLRTIPNLKVFRPSCANELIATYNYCLNNYGPKAIIITKDKVNNIEIDKNSIYYGAYVIKEESGNLDGIIIASGSEIHKAIEISDKLKEIDNKNVRVISMLSTNLFDIQTNEYKEYILPKNIKTFVIEAGSSYSYYKYVSNQEYLFTVDKFGASGSTKDVLKYMDLNTDYIYEKIKSLV